MIAMCEAWLGPPWEKDLKGVSRCRLTDHLLSGGIFEVLKEAQALFDGQKSHFGTFSS